MAPHSVDPPAASNTPARAGVRATVGTNRPRPHRPTAHSAQHAAPCARPPARARAGVPDGRTPYMDGALLVLGGGSTVLDEIGRLPSRNRSSRGRGPPVEEGDWRDRALGTPGKVVPVHRPPAASSYGRRCDPPVRARAHPGGTRRATARTLPCARGRVPRRLLTPPARERAEHRRPGAHRDGWNTGAAAHWHRGRPSALERQAPPSLARWLWRQFRRLDGPPGRPAVNPRVSPACGQFGPGVWWPRAHFLVLPYKFVAGAWFWWHRAPGGGATRDSTILDL